MKTMASRRSAHAAAFTLVEMLAATALFAVFTIIVADLFVVTIRAQQDATKRDSLFHRIDSAVALLRRDVWAATRIEVDGQRVALPPAQGPAVIWRCSPDGKLSRTTEPAGLGQSWGDLPPIAFTAHGPLLTLTLKAANHNETITLVSQQMEGAAK